MDKVFNCSSKPYIGVFNESLTQVFVRRTYLSLPPHDSVIFRIVFILIGEWSGSQMKITFDNKEIPLWEVTDTTGFTNNKCENFKGLELSVYGQAFHAANSLTLTISSTLNVPTDIATWGVREVGFIFINKSSTDTENVCAVSTKNFPVKCNCGDKEYNDDLGDCKPCHFACSSCADPSPYTCYSCEQGWDSVNGACGYDSCPVGMRVAAGKVMSDRQCQKCIERCDKCDSDLNDCDQCELSYLYDPTTKTCRDSCPAGYWNDRGNRVCRSCSANCKICSEIQCFLCEDDSYPFGRLCFEYSDKEKLMATILAVISIVLSR